MCIIMYKKKGLKLPSHKTIQACMDNNPDGAGYMFNTGNDVFIRKGFFDASELMHTLRKDLKSYKLKETSIDICIHARITSAGLTKPENCHPFPVSKSIGDLQALQIVSDIAIVHNGCIDIKDKDYLNLSDTQIYVRDILASVDLYDINIQKLIELSLTNSRLAVFDKDGLIFSCGNWTEKDKIFYSNSTYINYHSEWSEKYCSDFLIIKKDKRMRARERHLLDYEEQEKEFFNDPFYYEM